MQSLTKRELDEMLGKKVWLLADSIHGDFILEGINGDNFTTYYTFKNDSGESIVFGDSNLNNNLFVYKMEG